MHTFTHRKVYQVLAEFASKEEAEFVKSKIERIHYKKNDALYRFEVQYSKNNSIDIKKNNSTNYNVQIIKEQGQKLNEDQNPSHETVLDATNSISSTNTTKQVSFSNSKTSCSETPSVPPADIGSPSDRSAALNSVLPHKKSFSSPTPLLSSRATALYPAQEARTNESLLSPSTDYKPSNTSMIQQNATLFDYPNVAPSLSDASSPFQNNIPHSVLMENPGTSFWESSPNSFYTQAYSHPDLPTKQKKGQTYPLYDCISFFLASIRSQFLY